ncbi:MAG: hypothetical protein AAF702_12415 [Chloroflexota bacterium]
MDHNDLEDHALHSFVDNISTENGAEVEGLTNVIEGKTQQARNIDDLLRPLLRIRWDIEKELSGGYSKSTLVRIKPKMCVPSSFSGKLYEFPIPHHESIVIKYGPKLQIDKERNNYALIPPEYRGFFADISPFSQTGIMGDELYEFFIVRHLDGFDTFEESLFQATPSFQGHLMFRLTEFLRSFYTIPPLPSNSIGKIKSLYINPMFHDLETIHDFKLTYCGLDAADYQVFEDLKRLIKALPFLAQFPLSVMHGDLNIRNILTCRESITLHGMEFRLIDLDRFSRAGDMAVDIGELLADIQLSNMLQGMPQLDPMIERSLESDFKEFAESKGDLYFEERLEIAKAKAFIKVVKLICKGRFTPPGLTPTYSAPFENDRTIDENEFILQQMQKPLAQAYCLLRSAIQRLNS